MFPTGKQTKTSKPAWTSPEGSPILDQTSLPLKPALHSSWEHVEGAAGGRTGRNRHPRLRLLGRGAGHRAVVQLVGGLGTWNLERKKNERRVGRGRASFSLIKRTSIPAKKKKSGGERRKTAKKGGKERKGTEPCRKKEGGRSLKSTRSARRWFCGLAQRVVQPVGDGLSLGKACKCTASVSMRHTKPPAESKAHEPKQRMRLVHLPKDSQVSLPFYVQVSASGKGAQSRHNHRGHMAVARNSGTPPTPEIDSLSKMNQTKGGGWFCYSENRISGS